VTEVLQPEQQFHGYAYVPDDESITPQVLGEWRPGPTKPDTVFRLHMTDDPDEAQRWINDLQAGRLPNTERPDPSQVHDDSRGHFAREPVPDPLLDSL
jgi:hypothetical protein